MAFGFVAFPQVEELDLIGPWEIIRMWSTKENGPNECLIISQDGNPVTCAKGLRIACDRSFADCPELDFLLVPGGQGTRDEVSNQSLLSFVRDKSYRCRHIMSVCTGAFILQAAGLLKGRRATTHLGSIDRLRAFDDVTVIEERFVRDGNIWTAAGVSARIDLALAIVAECAGREVAGRVQLAAEYFPSGVNYSTTLTPAYASE